MAGFEFSIVVTAPHGIADCVFLDDLAAAARSFRAEIIIVDATGGSGEQGEHNILHLSRPARGIQGLIREGILAAKGEWILITEDHCKPEADLIERYAELLRDNPEIDLFSGAVDNKTSTSHWSTATYLIGLGPFSPDAVRAPEAASNANMLVRRIAILASELECDGGLLNLAVPRLIREGRYKHNPDALVDHVVPLSPSETVPFISHCTLDARNEILKTKGKPRSTARAILSSFRSFFDIIFFMPSRISRLYRDGQLRTRVKLCVRAVSAGLAFTVLGSDLKRILTRQ